MDMIKRSDALQALVDTEGIKGVDYRELEERLNAIPSIELIRCKECKYHLSRATEIDGMRYCEHFLGWTKDTDYCAWAERTEQTEPIPKDIVVPCGNGNVMMSEDTYDELIEQGTDCTEVEQTDCAWK